MKRPDLSQSITILANIGVIAGIVFLGYELRQNNDELQSQTRTNMYQMQAEIQRDVFTNAGGVTDLVMKAAQGQELTLTELNRLNAFRGYVLRTFEFMFKEDLAGARDSSAFMVLIFENIPDFLEFYEQRKDSQDPDFVRFLEQEIISQLN